MEDTPCYRDECDNAVADYDYESALLGCDNVSQQTQEIPPIEGYEQPQRLSTRILVIAGVIAALILGGVFFASTRINAYQDVAKPEPGSNTYPTWDDNFQPTIPPSVVTPRPEPIPPSSSPRQAPRVLCTDPATLPSAQALQADLDEVAAAWNRFGPSGVPLYWPSPSPGFTWVVGPPGRVPVGVENDRVAWWWNWRTDSNGCGEYYLEPTRRN